MTAWHHAYNGVPTTRKHQKNGKNGLGGDYPPVRHDHLLPNGLSGELHVSIKVASPTVPGQRTAKGQVVVSSRSGAVGGAMDWEDATIPATTLKGVLSSAYEAVTASRMRVFSGNDHVLTHRRTSQEAAILYPVFLVADRKTSGGTGLRARIMLGRNQRPENGTWDRLPCLCAAVLPDSEKSRTALYDKSGQLMYSGATKKRKRKYHNKKGPQHVRERLSQLRDATPHGSQVTFTVQEEDFYKTKRLIVSSVKGERFCGTVGHSKSHGPKDSPYTGYVVRLTPEGSDPLIDTKYNEFVFFDTKKNRTYRDISAQVLTNLVEVIHSYLENIRTLKRQEAHRRSAGAQKETKTRRSGSPNTWLIHSILDGENGGPGLSADREAIERYVRALASNEPGLPLFASIDNTKGTVTELSLSQVGRRVSSEACTPAELAEAGSIAPAQEYSQASPADRMWGFIADRKEDAQNQVAANHGRITIHPIRPAKQPEGAVWLRLSEDGNTGWSLPSLASPKPSTGFPYLHKADGGPLSEETTRDETYRPGQLLIRKVYPSHRLRIGQQLDSVPGVETLTGAPGSNQTVIGSYLTPGATFTTTINFEGLTAEELAVLVWLLTPERLVPRSEKPTDGDNPSIGFHRLGFGKPLGLGMVEIRATDVVVHDGRKLAGMYRDLTGCLGLERLHELETSSTERLTSLLNALPEGFESWLAVRAFVRSSYGWSDGKPVQYPNADHTTGEDEISPITTWFKNREENRVKHKLDQQKNPLDSSYDLPDLTD